MPYPTSPNHANCSIEKGSGGKYYFVYYRNKNHRSRHVKAVDIRSDDEYEDDGNSSHAEQHQGPPGAHNAPADQAMDPGLLAARSHNGGSRRGRSRSRDSGANNTMPPSIPMPHTQPALAQYPPPLPASTLQLPVDHSRPFMEVPPPHPPSARSSRNGSRTPSAQSARREHSGQVGRAPGNYLPTHHEDTSQYKQHRLLRKTLKFHNASYEPRPSSDGFIDYRGAPK